MRRVEKEFLKLDCAGDLSAAAAMATKAGYIVDCYDGDGETGPLPPVLYFYKPVRCKVCGRLVHPRKHNQEECLMVREVFSTKGIPYGDYDVGVIRD